MKLTSVAKVNSLFWITSLREGERGVTRRVVEDLEPFCERIGLPFEFYEPSTAAEVLAALDNIGGRARAGWLPVIHLDVHGSPERGIEVAQSGEFVGWPEIAAKLRAINIATRNNLCVISGACFSFIVVKQIDESLPAPFFILLAPEEEILAGDVEEKTVAFYRSMFNGLDILSAHETYFSEELRVFHCERMVAIVLARYIDIACIGRNAERRKEHLLSMAFERGVPNVRANRRKLRKHAEQQIKPNERLIQRFVTSFLIGKTPTFTVADLERFVREARAAGHVPSSGPYSAPPDGG